MQGLFNPVTILLHMLNTVILFVALYFLLYKPVSRFLNARRQGILKEIDDAHALHAQAETVLADSRDKQNAANMDAAAKAKRIQAQAQDQAQALIAAAKREAERIVTNAHKEAEEVAQGNKQAMRDFAASLAVDISAKILGREINDEDHRRLIDEFLKEVK